MANKRKCRNCSTYNKPGEFIAVNAGSFCNFDCVTAYGLKNGPNARQKLLEKKKKEFKAETKARRKKALTRNQWYGKLQGLINQWVVNVRDVGEPCITCGTINQNIKYDCGHRWHAGRGGADRRRFILQNLAKQCSVNCNQHGGGMPREYEIAGDKKYGEGAAEWLSCEVNFRTLKEQYPLIEDIENEIKRYRKILREAGLKPRG